MSLGFNDTQPPYKFTNVTADAAVKGQPGFLHGIMINAVTTAGVLTLYNNTSEASPAIAAIDLATRAAGAQVPHFLPFNIEFSTGLYAGFDGSLAADLTFATR